MNTKKETGVTIVRHQYAAYPRVKVFATYNLQPVQFNQISIGVEVEMDALKGTIAQNMEKAFTNLLTNMDKKLKVAFKKANFDFP